MADRKRSKSKQLKKQKPPKPRPPLEIIRHEDDRHGVEYCWKPVLFEGGIAKADHDGKRAHEIEAPTDTEAADAEERASAAGIIAMPKQVDPDYLSYAIYNVQIQALNGIYWFAKLLSTKVAVGGYPPATEAWRFSLQTVTSVLSQANSLQLLGTQYDATQVSLATYWFPPEPGWLNNEFTMPASITYPPATHTANAGVVFEAPFQTNYKMRLAFRLNVNAQGYLKGSVAWFINKPNYVGYLVKTGQAYSFTRLSNPTWPGQWYEDYYQSPP
jgi:hypothetical protein